MCAAYSQVLVDLVWAPGLSEMCTCFVQVVDEETGKKTVWAILADGRKFEGDVLIGADGIWSKVNSLLRSVWNTGAHAPTNMLWHKRCRYNSGISVSYHYPTRNIASGLSRPLHPSVMKVCRTVKCSQMQQFGRDGRVELTCMEMCAGPNKAHRQDGAQLLQVHMLHRHLRLHAP